MPCDRHQQHIEYTCFPPLVNQGLPWSYFFSVKNRSLMLILSQYRVGLQR